jgi:hypothetical protein
MSLIRAITGTETFSNGNAKMIVTVHPTTRFPLPPAVKSKFIGECAKNGNHVSTGQRAIYLPASNNGVREQGNFWDGTFNVPEGLVLRVYATRRERSASGRLIEQSGVIYIRARDEGALQRLQLRRIDHPQSTNAPVFIEGRFDIISLREVAAAGGQIDAKDLAQAKPERVGEVFAHEQVAPARRAAAKLKVEVVRGQDGETTNVVTTRTKRATNLG